VHCQEVPTLHKQDVNILLGVVNMPAEKQQSCGVGGISAEVLKCSSEA